MQKKKEKESPLDKPAAETHRSALIAPDGGPLCLVHRRRVVKWRRPGSECVILPIASKVRPDSERYLVAYRRNPDRPDSFIADDMFLVVAVAAFISAQMSSHKMKRRRSKEEQENQKKPDQSGEGL